MRNKPENDKGMDDSRRFENNLTFKAILKEKIVPATRSVSNVYLKRVEIKVFNLMKSHDDQNMYLSVQDVKVCRKAFISIHGISNNKVSFLTTYLKTDGTVAKDRRGTHSTRPRKLSPEILKCIKDHINSFPSRSSHYGLKESKKIHLCEP